MASIKDKLGEDLAAHLNLIKTAATDIWHSPLHKYYTDHRADSHSERVIEKLDGLAREIEPDEHLNEVESFVILAAAYGHDIGMQKENAEWKTLEDIREHHHEISRRMIEGSVHDRQNYPDLGLPADLADEVALVAAAHRRLDLSSSEFETRHKRGQPIRLRLLSAMLRLADSLDMDYRRVLMDNLKQADIPPESRLHWLRCHYVDAITIEDGTVQAECSVPTQDLAYYIKASIQRELNESLDKVKRFLWPTIKLSAGNAQTRLSAGKEPISDSDFAAIRQQVMIEVARSSENSFAEIRELRERDERTASQLADEAERIRESDPQTSAKHNRLAATIYGRLEMHHSSSSQIERAAATLKDCDDKAAAAEAYDDAGHYWLKIPEPIRAYHAYQTAFELTQEDDARSICMRKTNLAQALTFLGDFYAANRLIQEVADVLELNPVWNVLNFFGAQTKFLVTAQDWPRAFEVAKMLVDGQSKRGESDVLRRTYFEAAMVASHAGQHEIASNWIDLAKDPRAPLTNADAVNFHGRRGYILARSGRHDEAGEDFSIAMKAAITLGDDQALAIHHENLMYVNQFASRDFTTELGSHNKMQDLSHRTRLIQDEDFAVQTDRSARLFDTLSTTLTTLHVALDQNNLGGVAAVQRRLAQVFKSSGRLDEALKLRILIGDTTEVAALAESVSGLITGEPGNFIAGLADEYGNTVAEQIGLCTAIATLADVISDDHIDAISNKVLSWSEQSGPHTARRFAIVALATLSNRLSNEAIVTAARHSLSALSTSNTGEYELRKAAAGCLGNMARQLPENLHDDVVNELVKHVDDGLIGSHAWDALLESGRRFGAEQCNTIREFVRTRAIELRQIAAARCYALANYGPFPDELGQAIIASYIEQAQGIVRMIDTGKWTIGVGNSLSTIAEFAECISPEQLHTVTLLLLQLAQDPRNLLIHRDDAIDALGRISDRILAEDIPATIVAARSIAIKPELADLIKQLAAGATDPLQRNQLNMGSVSRLRREAVTALGRLINRAKPPERTSICKDLFVAAGDSDPEVRIGAALALKHAHYALSQKSRHASITQLYSLMHDSSPQVQMAATFASVDYLSDLNDTESSMWIERALVLATSGTTNVRLNATYLLATVAKSTKNADVRSRSKAALEQRITSDPSFRIRRKCDQEIALLNDSQFAQE